MSPTLMDSRAKWLESKIKLAHSRQQAIAAAFLKRFGIEASDAIARLPLPRFHPKTIEDKIAVVESREAAMVATFIRRYGPTARVLAVEAARKHGFETGRSARKTIHARETTPENIYNALRYFLLDGGTAAPEPAILQNTPRQIVWSRVACPQHESWSGNTAQYLFLVQIEGRWITGFVEGYCYTASHSREIFMNVGPASYIDTIAVQSKTL